MHNDRVLSSSLQSRIMTADQAADLIESGMTLGYSGFSVGYPQDVPLAVYEKGKAHDLTVLCGAATVSDTFRATGSCGLVTRFYGFQFLLETRRAISSGKMQYSDVHLGQFGDKIRRGTYGKIDYAIVECIRVNEDGGLVPTLSAGIVNALVDCAEKIIVEINTSIPLEMVGIHDFGNDLGRTMNGLLDRMGDCFLPCEPERIAAIVFTENADREISFRDTNTLYEDIAQSVVSCLRQEIDRGTLPKDFTLQVGTGGVANAVLLGLQAGGFSNLRMFTEVLTDGALAFLENGLFKEATTTCLDLSAAGHEKIMANPAFFKERIVIRPLDVTNNPRRIADMGLVAMNTALEADIYGNVNSSHALGVNMLNGIGGSNDFSRSARLSIFITPSTAKDGAISSIVPMVPHVDSTEHDTDIIATEYGYADLRGRSPKERAKEIIENCAHPDYRPQLRRYFEEAVELCGPCHTPHDLSRCFSWYARYLENGTMKES